MSGQGERPLSSRGRWSGVPFHTTPHINAVTQHENMSYRHDKGRSAKYLEKPLNSNSGAFGRIIAAELRGEL